jgi:hypothetical protein
MNFLIGNIEPNNPNETDFAKGPDGNDPNIDPNNLPEVDDKPKDDAPKKTNWVLYGLLGLVALSIILGNKK